jgi:hypothetical protein
MTWIILELWLAEGMPERFTFSDQLRADAKEVTRICSRRIKVLLLSVTGKK